MSRAVSLVCKDADGEERDLEIADECAERAMEAVCVRVNWELWVERLGLSERDKALVELLCAGYTQAEIAERLGITQQRVSQRLVRIRRLWGENQG